MVDGRELVERRPALKAAKSFVLRRLKLYGLLGHQAYSGAAEVGRPPLVTITKWNR